MPDVPGLHAHRDGPHLVLTEQYASPGPEEQTVIPIPAIGYVTLAYDIRSLGTGFRASYLEIGCGAHTWTRSEASDPTGGWHHPPYLTDLWTEINEVLRTYRQDRPR